MCGRVQFHFYKNLMEHRAPDYSAKKKFRDVLLHLPKHVRHLSPFQFKYTSTEGGIASIIDPQQQEREKTLAHNLIHFLFQREREETLVELETAKDRLEMAQASHNRSQEEKEITNKELERLLEKYDR